MWDGRPFCRRRSGAEASEEAAFEDVPPGGELYFVHSYEAKPAYDAHRLADTVYGGRRLCAAAQKGSVTGCQFHPEKSGKLGLSVIHRYLLILM